MCVNIVYNQCRQILSLLFVKVTTVTNSPSEINPYMHGMYINVSL